MNANWYGRNLKDQQPCKPGWWSKYLCHQYLERFKQISEKYISINGWKIPCHYLGDNGEPTLSELVKKFLSEAWKKHCNIAYINPSQLFQNCKNSFIARPLTGK